MTMPSRPYVAEQIRPAALLESNALGMTLHSCIDGLALPAVSRGSHDRPGLPAWVALW